MGDEKRVDVSIETVTGTKVSGNMTFEALSKIEEAVAHGSYQFIRLTDLNRDVHLIAPRHIVLIQVTEY